jgi:hypothetical protein
MLNKYFLIFTFLILLIFPPFVFVNLIPSIFRSILFFIFLCILIIKEFSILKIKFSEVLSRYWTHFLFLFIYLIIIIIRSFIFNFDFLISFGYYLIFLSATLFHIIIFHSEKKIVKKFIKYYIFFFKIICIFIILNFLCNLFFSINIGFLSTLFSNENYEYNVSIFGISINKFFGPINVSRNFFYFIEPVFASIFFIFNIFFISECLNTKEKNHFLMINLIAGILTFSFLFFVLLILVFFLKSISKFKIKQIFLGVPIALLLAFLIFSIFDSSSILERSIRFQAAFEEISTMKFIDYIFGFGYLKEYSLDRGFSAGILNLLLEGGAIIYLIFLYFLFSLSNSRLLFFICFISLFVLEPNKFPFFWISFTLSSYVFKTKFNFSNF